MLKDKTEEYSMYKYNIPCRLWSRYLSVAHGVPRDFTKCSTVRILIAGLTQKAVEVAGLVVVGEVGGGEGHAVEGGFDFFVRIAAFEAVGGF